jgi:peptidoglycan/LPS O-acetylase OafA/YrhL
MAIAASLAASARIAPQGAAMSYEDFRASRHFTELDGLRALSILLVVSIHTTDPLWRPLKGDVGVTIFFVISGFIITTLLLREEQDKGRVRIGAFYIRRAFRILPLYYLVLAAYVVLIGILRLQPGAEDLWESLPYFLTYQNDFASSDSGFAITWSLAIEEKFYLFWPIMFLPFVPKRWRWRVAAFLALAVAPFALASGDASYPAIYEPIILGCLVALLMHNPRTYAALRPLAGGFLAAGLIVAGAVQVVMFERNGNVHVVFAVIMAAALPACLTGPNWLRAVLCSRLFVYIGTRSYALYLVHRMGKGVIDQVIAPGGEIPQQMIRFILITGLGLLVAEVLGRVVEQPMIALGRRLTARMPQARKTVEADATGRGTSEGKPQHIGSPDPDSRSRPVIAPPNGRHRRRARRLPRLVG